MKNAILSLTRIDAFRVWLAGHGYRHEAPKVGEVLRVRKSPDVAPVVFTLAGIGGPVTSLGEGQNLVKKFMREEGR